MRCALIRIHIRELCAEDDCPDLLPTLCGAVFMEMSYCLKEKALKLRREDQTDPEGKLLV